MKNVKGIAKIEFFDKNGDKVKEVNEKNLITNSIQNFIDCGATISKNPLSFSSSRCIQITDALEKYENMIGGLLLFDDKINENPDIINYSKTSIASAGSKNDLSNPVKGSLNEQETGATDIDGKTAYRFVWDFGTANANCTFNTICLTTRRAGNRENPISQKRYATDFFRDRNRECSILNNLGNTITNNGQLITVNGQTNTIDKIEKINNISITDNIANIYTKKQHSLDGYTNFSNSHFYENGKLRFVAKHTVDDMFYLLSVNPETLSIDERIQLPGITFRNFVTFSMLDNYMLYNFRNENNGITANVYNMETKSIESSKQMRINAQSDFVESYNNLYFSRIMTFKSNGKYRTYFSVSYFKDYNSQLCAYINSLDEIHFLNGYRDSNGIRGMYCIPIIGFDINKGISMWSQTNNNNNNVVEDDVVPFFNGPEPLFTINTLANPVTKTEANTMKITYTLIYD